MGDEIAPAMTAEEWPEARRDRMGWGIVSDDPATMAIQVALANDALPADHPLKITREDLEALTEIIADAAIYRDEMGQRGHPDPAVEQTERLHAKLAALLPPEDAHG